MEWRRSTALNTIIGFTVLYALGEAQYSGKNFLRVTLSNTFLSRVDRNLKTI